MEPQDGPTGSPLPGKSPQSLLPLSTKCLAHAEEKTGPCDLHSTL